MSLLFIHVHDATFHSCDAGADYENPAVALALGIQGALDMASEEINQGERSSAVEISIRRADGTQVLRSMVAVSVSPLLPLSKSPVVVPIRQNLA